MQYSSIPLRICDLVLSAFAIFVVTIWFTATNIGIIWYIALQSSYILTLFTHQKRKKTTTETTHFIKTTEFILNKDDNLDNLDNKKKLFRLSLLSLVNIMTTTKTTGTTKMLFTLSRLSLIIHLIIYRPASPSARSRSNAFGGEVFLEEEQLIVDGIVPILGIVGTGTEREIVVNASS